MRSHHLPFTRTNWRTGKASRNSLPITIAGPSGTSLMLCAQDTAAPLSSKSSCCIAASVGLVSISQTSSASRNAGTMRAALSASLMSVPRPGPSSMRRNVRGEPMLDQTSAAQRPSNSPNICEISGAVVKSPDAPKGSRFM